MFLSGDYENYSFQHGAVSGAMAAALAAGSEIYQFRWTNANTKARILGVLVSAATGATGFTAGSANFALTRATAWTVAGSGGTDVTPTALSNALRTNQWNGAGKGPFSKLVGTAFSIQVAATAALVAGTKTFDSQPMAQTVGTAGAAGTQLLLPTALYNAALYGMPLVLGANEGFAIQATVPATGVWQFAVQTLWAEVD